MPRPIAFWVASFLLSVLIFAGVARADDIESQARQIMLSIPENYRVCWQDSDCMTVTRNCNSCTDVMSINANAKPDYDKLAQFHCGYGETKIAASCTYPTTGDDIPHPACRNNLCELVVPLPDEYKACKQDSDCIEVSTNCSLCGDSDAMNTNLVIDYQKKFTIGTCGYMQSNQACQRPIGDAAPYPTCTKGMCHLVYNPNFEPRD